MIKTTTRDIASSPNVSVPKLNFYVYQQGATYHNNGTDVDFVTDGRNLYVCAVQELVTTAAHIEDQVNLMKIVSEGETGHDGATGAQGIPGRTPRITARFDNGQVILYADGERIAATTDLTPPSWRPERINNTIVWERTRSNRAPAPINLDDLRAQDYKPLILRVDSDNTKRSDEESGPANFIQWKREGDEEWNNLIHISDLMNLALAGVSFWADDDGYYHFGHRQVIHATYDSTAEGHRVISDVELGDILFDAGKIPFANYEIDLNQINNKLRQLEIAVNSIAPVDAYSKTESDLRYQTKGAYLTAENLSDYAKKSEVPDAYTKAESDARFLKDSDMATINGQKITEGGNIVITGGGGNQDLSAYATKTELNNLSATLQDLVANGFNIKLKIEDNYLYISYRNGVADSWQPVGAVGGGGSGTSADLTALKIKIGDGSVGTPAQNHLYISYNNGSTWTDVGEFIDSDTIQDLTDYVTRATYQAGIDALNARIDNLAGGQFNVVTSRTFLVYRWYKPGTGDPAVPAKPAGCAWDRSTNTLTLAAGSPWKESPENNPNDGSRLWMTSATFDSDGTVIASSDWQTPICISGIDGNPGVDGDSVEFIFKLYADLAAFNADKVNIPPSTEPEDSVGHWYNHPQGIDVDHEIEGASMRIKDGETGQWGAYCTPFIWSMWGENGVDGDGVEYIYRLAGESDVTIDGVTRAVTLNNTGGAVYPPTAEDFEDNEFVVPPHYQENDWIPGGTNPNATTGITEEGWQSDTGWDRNWTDEPLNVNSSTPYQFVSIRKYDGVNKVWKPFSTPVLWNRHVVDGESVYTSYIFARTSINLSTAVLSNDTDPSDIVTTINGSIVNVEWSDSIPNGSAPVWMSYNLIGDVPDTGWSSPCMLGDSSRIQIEFSAEENAKTAYPLPNLNNDAYIDDTALGGVDEVAFRTAAGLKDGNVVWGDENDIPSPVWMATAVRNGGTWSGWTYAKIKGETGRRGEDGTSFAPIGTVNALITEYEGCTETTSNWKTNMASFNSVATVGASILVTVFDSNNIIDHTDMWVYTGETPAVDDCANGLVYGWRCVGPLQGPAGESSYIHQKFANEAPNGALCTVMGVGQVRLAFTPVTQPFTQIGEFPGKYVGMYVDFNVEDSSTITDYTWAKWSGDDGFGMEQIFILSATRPTTPTSSNVGAIDLPDGSTVTTNLNEYYYQYNVVPRVRVVDNSTTPATITYETWEDTPITPANGMPCWISVRKLDNPTLREWSQPQIYNRYAEDGKDGDYVEYIYHLYDHELNATELLNAIHQTKGYVSGDTNRTIVNNQHKDFIPGDNASVTTPSSFWSDNPEGVDAVNKYEYVSQRDITYDASNNPVYGSFSTPVIWSKFGENGRDGDGLEYVFFAVTDAQHRLIQSNNGGKLTVINLAAYHTQDEARPYCKYKNALNAWVEPGLQATDNNPGVTDARPFVYASKRKYHDDGTGGEWGDFQDAVLWAGIDPRVTKACSLSVENQNHPTMINNVDRVENASLKTTFNLGFLAMYDNSGTLRTIDNVAINGIDFVSFNNTNLTKTLSNNYVTLPLSTGTVTIRPAYAYISEHIYYSVSLSVTFTDPAILDDTLVLTITASNADGYSGSETITISPVFAEKIVTVLDTMPAAIKKSGEDATDYSPNQVMISGYMGINSLDAQRNMVLGYSLDGGAQKLVYLKNYITTPSGNDRSTFNFTEYGGSVSAGVSDATLYFDESGNRVGNAASAVFTVRFYNSDDNQRNYDDYSCYGILDLTKLSAVVKNNVLATVGYNQTVTDTEPVGVIYPGKQGEPGETVVTYQYLDGKVVRVSDWTDPQNEYSSGATAVNGIYYLDVVRYVSGQTTSYYKCKADVTYSNNKPASPASDPSHWEAYTPQSDSWFETMLANSAYINQLSAKQVIITDGNDIVAGMASGADVASASGANTVGNVRIWAGEPETPGDLTTAPFTVNNDGAVRADNINLAGGNISGTLTIGGDGKITSRLTGSGSSHQTTIDADGFKNSFMSGLGWGSEVYMSSGIVEIENGSQGQQFTKKSSLDSERLMFRSTESNVTNEHIAVTTPVILNNAVPGSSFAPIYSIVQVLSLPVSPDPNTLYIVIS